MVKLKDTPYPSAGFTLIEVLITIIVVSIGLLGLAGLQISGLKANMGSETRSKATLLASDIAERIRANPLGVHNSNADADNLYANLSTAGQTCNNPPDPFCSNYNSGPAASCTPAQMATFDAWVWACGMPVGDAVPGGVTNVLMDGAGSVTCNDIDNGLDADDCSPGSPHTITITWNAANPDFTGNNNVAAVLPQAYTLIMVP